MRSSGGFYKAVWVFVGVICVAVPLFAAADWTEDRFRLEWRNYLTQVWIEGIMRSQGYQLSPELECILSL